MFDLADYIEDENLLAYVEKNISDIQQFIQYQYSKGMSYKMVKGLFTNFALLCWSYHNFHNFADSNFSREIM